MILSWNIRQVRFGAVTALTGVDGVLSTGERHALIGPNGAGKTTLLNVLAGQIPPARLRGSATVRADGALLRGGPATRARAGIGRTFQTPTCLPALTCRNNLRTAALTHRPHRLPTDRVDTILDRLHLTEDAEHLAGELSHGRRRLLDLGMALIADPQVLLLDEPAAGLGDHDRQTLITVLRELPATVSVLLVEHDLDLVTALAGQVTVLDHGRVLATGKPRQIRNDPQVRTAYLGPPTPGEAR